MTPLPIPCRLAAALAVAAGQAAGCAAAGRAAPQPDQPDAATEPPPWPEFASQPPEATEGPIRIERSSIGSTAGGVAIPLYTLWSPGEVEPGRRPAVLVVAGADGRHEVGFEVARDLIAELQGAGPDAFARTTLYIVPMLNPDAFGRDGPLDAAVPGGTLTPRDDDRDGRTDEDGPADLNGDDLITMMRIENPPPGWGLEATKVIDPDEPRLMRDPKPEEGERATHAVIVEGRDTDGDGRIAEDGAGGVDLDRNFPYLWPEHEPDAGLWPPSEPESRALVDWMLERPNIYAVLVYGPNDTLVNIPPAGKFDATGRVPTGIETDDKPIYERISTIFKEITGQTGAPTGDNRGSLQGWAYGHFGVLSFSTPVWVRPDLVKDDAAESEDDAEAETDAPSDPSEAAEPETVTIAGRTIPLTVEGVQAAAAEVAAMPEAEQQAAMAAFTALPAEMQARLQALAQGQAPEPAAAGDQPEPPASKKKPAGKSDEAKWLAWSDERDGAGFIDWATFEHPDLGPVEIGGFRPGFQLNPPEDQIPGLVAQQAEFVAKLLEMAPQLVIETPRVERLGAGVWRISLRLRNDGELATRSAIGVKARRLPPLVLHLSADDDTLIAGSRVERTSSIEPAGGTADHEWIVRAEPATELTLTIRSAEWGDTERTVTLEETP